MKHIQFKQFSFLKNGEIRTISNKEEFRDFYLQERDNFEIEEFVDRLILQEDTHNSFFLKQFDEERISTETKLLDFFKADDGEINIDYLKFCIKSEEEMIQDYLTENSKMFKEIAFNIDQQFRQNWFTQESFKKKFKVKSDKDMFEILTSLKLSNLLVSKIQGKEEKYKICLTIESQLDIVDSQIEEKQKELRILTSQRECISNKIKTDN